MATRIIYQDEPITGNLVMQPGSLQWNSQTDNIVSTGTTQSGAMQLVSECNRVTTVAAGSGVVLPPSQAGLNINVINHGANALKVYGFGNDTVDEATNTVGVNQMVNSNVTYQCNTPGIWYTQGLNEGYELGTGLQTMYAVDGITAHSGGGQASAVPLVAMMNRITTVAVAADSVVLPASAPGLQITVTNAAAANALAVFPKGTDSINALGASTAFSLTVTKSVTFICYTAGQWHTLPLTP